MTRSRYARMPRSSAAVIAGTIAIVLNTLALALADLIPLTTAHGGLLRLVVLLTGGVVQVPKGAAFQTGFHIVVGLIMALLYGLVLEPLLTGPGWCRGLLYAAAVWLANALIVLPVLDEGFAGSRYLTLPGMIWFGVCHTLFFVTLAVLYARLAMPRLR
jgi:hypothetical protein